MTFLKNDPVLKDRRRELRRNQTDAEKALWAQVRSKQFFGLKFFRQYSVGLISWIFIVPRKNWWLNWMVASITCRRVENMMLSGLST